MEHQEQIIKLRENGMTYRDIAKILGISFQRVHQIASHRLPNVLGGVDNLREKARIRDCQTCQLCGKVWKVDERKFDVHHTDVIIEGNLGRKYRNNKDLTKMITLCHKCHMNLPSVREKMINGWKLLTIK